MAPRAGEKLVGWVTPEEWVTRYIQQQIFSMNKKMLLGPALFSILVLCSSPTIAQISKSAINSFLNDSAVKTGHVGISIYDPSSGKYLYNYNAEKNFLPSSNTKLFTLYAGMKYLRDSLKGIEFLENDSAVQIFPTGDPTFLHPDFSDQRVFDFLKKSKKKTYLDDAGFNVYRYGKGWSWDDYEEDFMAERSLLPIYGNVISFTKSDDNFNLTPNILNSNILSTESPLGFAMRTGYGFGRDFFSNNFFNSLKRNFGKDFKLPFITSKEISAKLLSDTLHKLIELSHLLISTTENSVWQTIHSLPVDSLFRPMMFNSDNFFAEQTLLMVSNERLGYMSDEDIIDTLLNTDFKDIPTKPRWVDGSGLSRYDLFSPKDFVYILVKLKNEFGQARMDRILPAGGEGTLTGYYGSGDYIHAKTGSMSNNVSLSGYLMTAKKKLLIFSVIINNFSGSGHSGRRAIEQFIQQIRATN